MKEESGEKWLFSLPLFSQRETRTVVSVTTAPSGGKGIVKEIPLKNILFPPLAPFHLSRQQPSEHTPWWERVYLLRLWGLHVILPSQSHDILLDPKRRTRTEGSLGGVVSTKRISPLRAQDRRGWFCSTYTRTALVQYTCTSMRPQKPKAVCHCHPAEGTFSPSRDANGAVKEGKTPILGRGWGETLTNAYFHQHPPPKLSLPTLPHQAPIEYGNGEMARPDVVADGRGWSNESERSVCCRED